MRWHFFVFGIFAASLLPLRANLGDSVAQVVKHYGTPAGYSEANDKNPFGTIVFRASGYELILFILQGKEVGARISKIDKSAFTDAEIKTIMDTEDGPWTPTPSGDPVLLEWTRKDLSTVLYDTSKQMLMLTTPEMAQAVRAAGMQK